MSRTTGDEEDILLLVRKLREGIIASQYSNGNYIFCVQGTYSFASIFFFSFSQTNNYNKCSLSGVCQYMLFMMLQVMKPFG